MAEWTPNPEPNTMMPGNYQPTILRNVIVKPQGDRILVRPDASANKTEGGILLPDQARGKPTRGTVIAVGPGRITETGCLIEVPFEVGQEVLYGAFSETGIRVDDEELLLLKAADVYVVLEPIETEVEEPVEAVPAIG